MSSVGLAASAIALTIPVGSGLAIAQQAPASGATTASPGRPATAQRRPAPRPSATPAAVVNNSSRDAEISLDAISVTATKTAESVIDTMAGASTVTRRQIDQQMPGSVSQILQNVPGVASEVTPNDPGQSINIRGMQDFGRVNILIDGARQDYQISGHNGNGTFYLEPEFVGQADVVRGPVANIYGSGAIGGVVSFRTRDIDDLLSPDENYGGEERFIMGTNGAGAVTSTSAGARIGTAADIYGQLITRNSGSYADGLGVTIPDTGSNLVGGLMKLNVRPTDSQQISASAMLQNFNFTNDGTSNDGARFANKVTTGNYTLGYTLKSPDAPLVDLNAKVYYTNTKDQQTYLAPDASGLYPALGVVSGAQASDKIDGYGFDVHNTSRFVTGALGHELTVGGDGVINQVQTLDQAGGYVSALTPSGQRNLGGAFVQDEVRYANWLRVLGAVRYDGYSLSGDGTQSSGSHVSPKLTIGVTPIRGAELYTTYAEGYRAPSITETLINGVHPYPAFTFLSNPNLKPETAHNFEGGVNLQYDNVWRPGDSLRAKATAFTNLVDNYIDLEQVGTATAVSLIPGVPNSACAYLPAGYCYPFQPFQYVNVAQARLTGVEFEGAYDWGGGLFSLAASAINGKNLSDGMGLATVPPYRATATLAFRFLENKSLTIGARYTAVAGSETNVPDSGSISPSAGYGLIDLFGSYAINKNASADFSVTNLFNKQYTQFLTSEPNPGLTAKIGVTLKFAAR